MNCNQLFVLCLFVGGIVMGYTQDIGRELIGKTRFQFVDMSSEASIEWVTPYLVVDTTNEQYYQLHIIIRKQVSMEFAKQNLYIYCNGETISGGDKDIISGGKSDNIELNPKTQQGLEVFCRITLKQGENIIEARFEENGETFLLQNRKIYFIPNKRAFYVLTVGPNDGILQYLKNDAADIAEMFENQSDLENKSIYNQTKVYPFLGEEATHQAVRLRIELVCNAVDSLYKRVKVESTVIVFISSHGLVIDDEYCFPLNDYDSRTPISSSLKFSEIINLLAWRDSKNIIFIDACKSGNALSGLKAATVKDIENTILKEASNLKNFCIIASARGDENSYEDSVWKNGAFSEALLKGLGEGMADSNKNGRISINEITDYLQEAVPPMVEKHKMGKSQHPIMLHNGLKNMEIYVVP